MSRLARLLPATGWLRQYTSAEFNSDLIAAAVVTVMLIPQSLAYAMLAGAPPVMGLYASILPLVAYALFGSSRTLSVGPVAIVSLMTATAVGQVVEPGSAEYISATITLALLSGVMMLLMGLLRFGMLANLLSHPVVAGFITASSIIIVLSQLKHILGISAQGENAFALTADLLANITATNLSTLCVGGFALAFLFWARKGLSPLLEAAGLSTANASRLAKAGPVLAVIVTTLAAWMLELDQRAVALVGAIPAGLPSLSLPTFEVNQWRELAGAALLISIIGYVESVSVGKTLAAKRGQRIDANQELIGLGAANVASAVSGGIPVTGGFSRSVVNFEAGAATQMASILTAIGIGLAALLLTPYLAYLPKATLAAAIIVAISSLIDLSSIKRAWLYSKSDFIAVATTIGITLGLGVELGVICGVVASIALHLHKTSQPHIAVVGEVPGTEHFRNVERHRVITTPRIVTLRIDESLYFANVSFVEDKIYAILAENPEVEHIILMCTAINEIDLSALEVLESVNERIRELGADLHLSEVKGPVMDALKKTDFLDKLTGKVYLSQHQAIAELEIATPSVYFP
ncbi:sulfate permease [Halieaceae bacterium IMCC14734]|uniref:Sulfate permease n=1 Tax=Candidatus Litorirhabdus singularis TaxID=2518993 RepID=A0ABT3TND6_9GAMM|nr:sulfate permease [Candidatus Litorirhabdus singularis]MCX2982889.1 sulfate permease [Candidatus Litorirhabdus singularis]